MLGVPVFRKQVLRMLADRNEVGTMLVRAAGGATAENALGAYVGHGYDTADPLVPPPGSRVAFRTCDVYAHVLAGVDGTPKCELYWPANKRDAAVARCAEVLSRYGDRYRPADPVNADPIDGELVLPPLDRPATPNDVKAGRAVFSLLGDGRPADQVRVVPLPGRPVRAKWATLKAYPRDVPRYVPEAGGQKIERVFEQDGKIWQAEEVLEGGRWRRYLGFVGRYDVARVAAEEVEVTAGWYGGDLTRGLACTVCPPGIDETGRTRDERPRLGDPLTLTAFLGNRTGLDQAVPARYAGQGPDGKPVLIAGVRLRLFVSERSIGKPSPDRIYVGYDRRDDWRELPANPRPPLAGDPGSRALAMGERAVAFRVDLRDWFDVARPGDYEVQVEFDERQGGPATGTSQRMAFPSWQSRRARGCLIRGDRSTTCRPPRHNGAMLARVVLGRLPVHVSRPAAAAPIDGFAADRFGDEQSRTLFFEDDTVRAVVTAPRAFDAGRPTLLLVYALPNGNTIEQTVGCRPAAGLDWRFDIQHVAAQVRRVRELDPARNVAVAYVEADTLSWPAWRQKRPDAPRRIAAVVNALAMSLPGRPPALALAAHSGGGAFVLSYLDAADAIPAAVERIAFLDANYSFDPDKRHGTKLAEWLGGGGGGGATHDRRHLVVVAYDDRTSC
jgi:hypothetical protein